MMMIMMMQAYKNRIKKTKEVQKKLPGLTYTPDQLFFIGASQVSVPEIVVSHRRTKTLSSTC